MEKIVWAELEEEEVTPQMHRRMIWGKEIMMSRMRFKDGFVVPLHDHHNEQLSTITKGTMRIWLGVNKEEVFDIHAGESIIIPGGVPHEALMIGEVEAMDIWSPPRQDWIEGTDDYLKQG